MEKARADVSPGLDNHAGPRSVAVHRGERALPKMRSIVLNEPAETVGTRNRSAVCERRRVSAKCLFYHRLELVRLLQSKRQSWRLLTDYGKNTGSAEGVGGDIGGEKRDSIESHLLRVCDQVRKMTKVVTMKCTACDDGDMRR